MQKYILNIIIWASLIALTMFAYLYTEQGGSGAPYLILAVASVKFLAIGLQFMEGRHAHFIWPIWLAVLLTFYTVGILYFSSI